MQEITSNIGICNDKSAFQIFLEEVGDLSEAELNMLETFSTNLSPTAMGDLEKSEEYFDLMCRYESFYDKTLSGQHGLTQQYWMIYIKSRSKCFSSSGHVEQMTYHCSCTL